MFAMVASGTRLSVCDDNRFPPPRAPLAGVSVDSIATFQRLLARVSFQRLLAVATVLLFAVGLDRITTIPRRELGFSAFGLTNTGTFTRFSEKLGSQAESLC
jgi:hypothetical protein